MSGLANSYITITQSSCERDVVAFGCTIYCVAPDLVKAVCTMDPSAPF